MLDNEPKIEMLTIDPGVPGDYRPWGDQVQDWLDSLPSGRSLFFLAPHPRDQGRVMAVTIRTRF